MAYVMYMAYCAKGFCIRMGYWVTGCRIGFCPYGLLMAFYLYGILLCLLSRAMPCAAICDPYAIV